NQQQFSIAERPLYQTVNNILVFVPPLPSALDFFPNVPPTALLLPSRQIRWRVASDLQSPTVYLAGVQVERQLPHRMTATVGYYTVHIQHVIRSRDINAPLPGTITALNPQGDRPFGNIGEIYQSESSGRFDQNQVFISINSRFSRTFSFQTSYALSKTK